MTTATTKPGALPTGGKAAAGHGRSRFGEVRHAPLSRNPVLPTKDEWRAPGAAGGAKRSTGPKAR